MKSSLASVLTSRTTRVVALFISVSAIALGGFFISQARANDIQVIVSQPASYVRGVTTINWTDNATTTTADPFVIQYSTDSFATNGNTITTSGVANISGDTYVGSYDWDTITNPHVSDGAYQVRAEDASKNFGTKADFVVDNTAPVTTLASSSPDTNGWYNIAHAPTITLTCADQPVNSVSSGCSGISYEWLNATSNAVVVPFATTTALSSNAITLSGSDIPQGDNILVYYSADNAVDKGGKHNVEDAKSAEFKVDTVAPSISSYMLNGQAANAYFNPAHATTTVVMTAREPVTWTTIEIKNASGYKIFSPGNFGLIGTTTWGGRLSGGDVAPDGIYSLYYTITDAAGNTTGGPAGPLTSNQIIVDTTNPTVTLTSPTDKVYKGVIGSHETTDTSALSFTSSDTNPLTYTYSIDGLATTLPAAANNDGNTAITSAIYGLSDGRHTIVVTVTDGAGNSVSSAPVSFVFDDNNTLTVSNKLTDGADFSTIGAAISAATTGDTIDIFPGTYTEDVSVNKSLTLQSHSGASGTTIDGLMTITADNTTVKNLSFTNPDASTALAIIGANTVSVTGNTFDSVGTSLTAGSAQAIDVNGGSNNAMSGITISGNTITNVGSANLAYSSSVSGTSAKGIYIGDSTGTNTISGVTIDNNKISNITASPTPWVKSDGVWTSKVGRGAYGILVNHSVPDLKITTNTISGLDGFWAHAIGLEGNTPGATVTGNIISGLTDNKGGTDDVGVLVQDNAGAGSVTIAKNQFAQNIIGVINEGAGENPTTATATTTATGNYWGSNEGPRTTPGFSTLINPHGAGAWVYGPVSYVPWCIDASCSLDTSTPTATLSGTPELMTNVTSISVTVGTSGDVAYYKYQLDGGAWSDETPIATPIATSSLADGSHTLNVLGRDQAGNWQTTPTTYSWTIDTVKPVLAQVTPVTTPTSNKTPEYVFSTTKPGTITYAGGCTGSLTNVTEAGNATTTFAALTDGVYSACKVTLTDSAGNTDTLPVTEFQIDTTAPVVNAGADQYVKAETNTAATVTDTDGSGIKTYEWTQVSGPGTVAFGNTSAENTTISASADGVYTLKLTATDNAGNVGSGTMTLTWDKTAPSIAAPSDVTMEATGPTMSVTLGSPIVSDILTPTGDIVVKNDAPEQFTVGTTIVTWTATDKAGNSSTATQHVVITDKTAPSIVDTPSDITAEATSHDGADVTYTNPTATDFVDGTSDEVTCLPASDGTFPLGVTTVTCNASDKAGNAATPTTFKVTVQDKTAPGIATHTNMTVTADQLGGNKVTYIVNSTDAVDGTVLADCAPASGSLFPVNETTTVTCNQTDAAGNTATPTTFTVTVNPDALAQIGISADPMNLDTAHTSTITVSAEDQYGNLVPTDNSTIVMLSTDSGGSLTETKLTLANGMQTTTLSSNSAIVVHVNAQSDGLIPNAVAVTFTGATVPDTTAPVITNVQSTNIGTSTVQVTWTTNELATSQVEYGTTSGYGTSSALDSTPTASHSVTLTGLTANTLYHFRVKSADAATNLATSGDNTFTTVVDDNTATLATSGIDATKSYAAADGTFDNGWKWTFHVTVPTSETQFSMKFSDFKNIAGDIIPAGSNIRIYSAQSSDAASASTAKPITSAGVYTDPMTLTTDLDASKPGRQIDVTVEMAVPTGSAGGSYSASYGLQSSAALPG